MEKWGKTTKNLNEGSRKPDRSKNQTPPEYKSKNYPFNQILRILLKRIYEKRRVTAWTALKWLKIRSSNRCSGLIKSGITIPTTYYWSSKGHPSMRLYKAWCRLYSIGEKKNHRQSKSVILELTYSTVVVFSGHAGTRRSSLTYCARPRIVLRSTDSL